MKNIHILPTDEPSRLHNTFGILRLEKGLDLSPCNLNIYITSDEEIKDADWCFHSNQESIIKIGVGEGKLMKDHLYLKKIILTTDQDLISDGVQAIDDEFIEWFVKNPSCKEVETERLQDGQYVDRFADGSVVEGIYENYKIIIPTEEPKQTIQEYEEQGLEKYSYELEPKQETIEKEMIENMVELLKEDIECVHMYLDDKQVPRQNDNGSKYSIIGRIKKLEASFQKQLSELESYYLTKSK